MPFETGHYEKRRCANCQAPKYHMGFPKDPFDPEGISSWCEACHDGLKRWQKAMAAKQDRDAWRLEINRPHKMEDS